MELGGTREIEKISFFTYGIFREFLAISRKPERQLFRGNKKYFPVQKTRNIWVEGGVPRSLTMQLMPQLFLR